MQMGRPADILLGGPERREALAASDCLANPKPIKRFTAQMTIKREEFRAVSRLMPQDDHRPVVLQNVIVGERVHYSGERRMHRRSGRRKEIESDVNRAAFVRESRPGREKGSSIEQTRLVI